jgi:NAD(P)-dependent dehydrogenase (short-subunit alcohol dehydrogenase family)
MKLNESIAFITGANRGLGLEFATALLAAGAKKVYAASRDPLKISLPGVHAVRLDVTNEDEVMSAVRLCGDVTLLINNAGIAQRSPFLGGESINALRSQLDVNFFGPLAMSRAFAPVLKSNGGGAIVNMLSVLSWVNISGMNGYCASKAAAWSLTNGLRNELREQQTLVIGVHAAFIDTDMTKHLPVPKTSTSEVARQVMVAIEAGREEVFCDETTKNVKNGLSSELAPYLRDVGR